MTSAKATEELISGGGGVTHKSHIEACYALPKKKERKKVGDNNGQATHGACKHAWRTQAAWAKIQISVSGK